MAGHLSEDSIVMNDRFKEDSLNKMLVFIYRLIK
jgi:hypothetical protein